MLRNFRIDWKTVVFFRVNKLKGSLQDMVAFYIFSFAKPNVAQHLEAGFKLSFSESSAKTKLKHHKIQDGLHKDFPDCFVWQDLNGFLICSFS